MRSGSRASRRGIDPSGVGQRVAVRAASFAMLLWAAAGGAAAGPQQRPEQAVGGPPVFGADVSMVMIDVSVLDENGLPVAGLTIDDFRIFEDGAEQPVSMVLKPNDTPADIGLLLDLSGSVRNDVLGLRRDALAFLDALQPEDCVYFLPFGATIGDGHWGRPNDPGLRAMIDDIQVRGGTPLYDAVIVALQRLEHAERCAVSTPENAAPRRKALVVLTDGHDTASASQFAAAINAAWEAEVPIFPVGVGLALRAEGGSILGASEQRRRSTGADARVKGGGGSGELAESERAIALDHNARVARESSQQRFETRWRSFGAGLAESLHELADISGGKFVNGGESAAGLSIAYNEVLNWLRASYRLGYYPARPVAAGTHRGRAEWREIEVRAIDDGLRLYARPGYFLRDVDPVAGATAVQAGVEMLRAGRADESIVAFGRALEADPFNWQAHYYRGRALGSRGRIQEAGADFMRAAELGPGVGEVHEFAVIAATDAGDFDTAWEQGIRALQAGHDIRPRLDVLTESAPPPANFDDRLAAPRLYIGRVVVPDPAAQAALEAVLRGLRYAVSESPEFGLVLEPGLADYFLRLQVNEVDTEGRGRVAGPLELLEPGDERPVYSEGIAVTDLFEQDYVVGALERELEVVAGWLRRRR